MSRKNVLKLMSCILSASITMQIGWQLCANSVYAATSIVVQNTEIGPVIELNTDFPENPVYIVSDVNGYRISCEDDGFEDKVVSSIGRITIEGATDLYIKTDIKTEIEMGRSAAQVFVEPGVTFECDELYAEGGNFYNEGTMIFSEFIASSLFTTDSAFVFSNEGTIEASVIDVSYATGFGSSSTAKYVVSNTFVNGSETLQGTVVADRSATITSYGGTITLEVDGATRTIVDEYFENKQAYTLLNDASVTLDEVPDILVGQTPDFSSLIHTADGYEGTPYIEYSRYATTGYTTDLPTTAGEYYVRAHAPASGSYMEDYSDAQLFNIDYLDVSEVFPDGNYFTFENLVDGQYVDGDVKVVPISSDYQISFDGENFTDYAMVSEEEVLADGHINYPYVMFKLKAKDGGAETDNLYVTNTMSANFESIIFDYDTPYYYSDFEDEPTLIEDGEEIMEEEPVIVIADRTLASVTIGDDTFTEDDFSENDYGEKTYTASFTTTPGTIEEVTIQAVDKLGKESTLTVTLKSPYLGDDVAATVSINGTIYVDDDYEPTVTVTGTEIPYSVEFVYDGEEEDPPTAYGSHTVMAIVYFEGYEDTIETDEFEYFINRYDFTPTVTVDDIHIGDSINPVLDGVPDDYEGTVVYEYKLDTEPESAFYPAEPTAVGDYSIRAVFEETDKYDETSCTDDFSISKYALDATVAVENIIYGGTVTPVVTTDPDDYEGSITYEYKLASEPDTAYTTDVPSEVGIYSVRATLYETYYYPETVCESTFTIGLPVISASVTVEDIEYGGTINPVVTTDPDDYDGTITYEYKLESDPDTAYSATVPTAVGSYSVRATLADTDDYAGTVCEGTFAINRRTISASVTVEDITYGGTITPLVTTDPDDYEGTITYEYKLSTDPDSAYSSTVPVNAGAYSIRATLAQTDIYSETVCEGTFNIGRGTISATVTVEDIYVGESPNPVVTTDPEDYSGDITFEYKTDTASEDAFDPAEPTAAGNYTVRAVLDDTENYNGTTSTAGFAILKHTLNATVSVEDIEYGGTITPVVTTDPDDYEGDITYEYKLESAPDSAYSSTAPTAVGSYSVRATLAETYYYEETVCEGTFTISRRTVTASVAVDDFTLGERILAVVTTDPSDYAGTITYEYKLSTEPDSAYTTTEPTAAGTYTVRATLETTAFFLGTSCTAEFTINRIPVTAEMTVGNCFIGETPSITIVTDPTDYDGDRTIEYKLVSDPDTAYTTTVPSAAGTYIVRATLEETESYLGTTCTANFTMQKIVISASVSVGDIHVGETINPILNTEPYEYNGTVTYEYKALRDPDTAYTTTAPTAAGDYSIRATLSETDTFAETDAEGSFSILRNDIAAEVTIADIYVGETPNPIVTTDPYDYDGDITFEYKTDTASEDAFDPAEPTAAGNYTVRATLEETDTYNGTSCTADFAILKNTLNATVTVEDITYGGTIAPVVTTDPDDYEGDITYEYKLESAPDSAYSSTAPTAVGSYSVRATLAETYYYEETVCEGTFSISQGTISASVVVEDISYGGTITPLVTTDPDDYDGTITYEYKLSTDPDTAYSATVPTAGGTYTVRATLASTDNYLGTSCTDEFTINRLPVTATVEVDNAPVDYPYSPYLETDPSDYDGNVIYEYKLESDPDSAYSTTRPSAVGSYSVRATLEPTDVYEGTTCTTTFNIFKISVDATIYTEDIYAGERPDVDVETDPSRYDGRITYEYKLTSEPDSSYTTSEPEIAGTYNVRATLPDTDKYYGTTVTGTFTVLKNDDLYPEVTVADIYVGETPNPVVTTDYDDYDGTITFEYKLSSAPDTAYSSTVPTAAGTYTVRATLSETGKYLGDTCSTTFNINKKPLTATVSAEAIRLGETPDPVVEYPDDYEGTVSFEYKLESAPDSEYSSADPSAAGTYTIRATLSESEIYEGTTCTGSLTVNKKLLSVEVYADNVAVNEPVNVSAYPVLEQRDYNGDITYEFKLSSDPDTAYTATEPTAVGEYTVRATFAPTDTYEGTTGTATFTIFKVTATFNIYTEDIYVGEHPDVDVEVTPDDYRGTYTYEYKLTSEPDSAYTTTEPTAAGAYTVRVTLSETDKYYGSSETATFNILKYDDLDADVTVADIFVGETPSPVVETDPDDYDGVITFEYKVSTDPDTAYSSTVPTAAGTYTVRATLAESDAYLGTTCTGTFTINKIEPTASVTVASIIIGGTVNPVLTTNSDGKNSATYEYKVSGAPDQAYSTTVPTAAGTYTVRATIPETATYLGTSCTADFTISRRSVTATVTAADITVGGTVSPVVTTDSDGKANTTFEYKLESAPDSSYSSTVPYYAGTYSVRATVPQTAEYERIVCEGTFTISLNTVSVMELSVPDIYVGQTVTTSFRTDSDGAVTIMFKASSASDSEYTTTAPTANGNYIARATVAETLTYYADSCTVEFKISYLDAPDTAFTPSGTEGNNGFFTSDVELNAPDGYEISSTYNGTYSSSIPYDENLSTIYLKRKSDGALTSAIAITNKPKIDKDAPTFSIPSGEIANNSTHYGESLVFTADDPHLKSLTVNGDPVILSTLVNNTLTLSVGYGFKVFTIIAEDEAGNISKIKFTLMAEWLRDRYIPADVALPLVVEEYYNLNPGQWTVNDDATVYNGGMQIYVRENADYTFTQVR